jgi:hypothetical protein
MLDASRLFKKLKCYAFSYSYDFHCGGVKWESGRSTGITESRLRGKVGLDPALIYL